MPPDGPHSFSLKDGDSLRFERGAGRGRPQHGERNLQSGQYTVRLFRDGKDMGLLSYTDEDGKEQYVTLNKETPTLILTGSAKGSNISIPSSAGREKGDYLPRLSIKTDSPITVTGAFISTKDSTQQARVPSNPVDLANLDIRRSKKEGEILVSTDKDTSRNNPEKNRGLGRNVIFLKYLNDTSRSMAGVEKGSEGIQFFNTEDRQKNMFLLEGDGSLKNNRTRYADFVEETKDSVAQALSSGNKDAQKRLGIPEHIPSESDRSAAKPPRGRSTQKVDVSAVQRQEMRAHGRKLGDAFQNLVNQHSKERERFEAVPEFESTLKDAQKIAQRIGQTGSPKPEDAKKLVEGMDAMMQQANTLMQTDPSHGMSVRMELEKIKRSEGFKSLTASYNKEAEQEKGDGKEQSANERPLSAVSSDVLAQARAAVDPSVSRQQAASASHEGQKVASMTETTVSGNSGRSA